VTANDNTLSEDDGEEISEEEFADMLSTSAHIGTQVERSLTLAWLRQNAADFLFAPGLDPKLQEYGTTVLELVAEAIAEKEHWSFANISQETMQ
jgi:hypothetical protein